MFFDLCPACCTYSEDPGTTVQRVVTESSLAPVLLPGPGSPGSPGKDEYKDLQVVCPAPALDSRDLGPAEPTAPSSEAKAVLPRFQFDQAEILGLFNVSFDFREGQLLGLEFDMVDSDVCIVSVVRASGLVEAHNNKEGLPAHQQIRPFDQVIAVNGTLVLKSQDLPNQLQMAQSSTDSSVTLSFKHPEKSEFTIDRQGSLLGIGLAASRATPSILVKKIEADGAMSRMNKADGRTYLMPHDRIIEVNGKNSTSDRSAMARSLAENVVKITICRYYLVQTKSCST